MEIAITVTHYVHLSEEEVADLMEETGATEEDMTPLYDDIQSYLDDYIARADESELVEFEILA